MGRDGTQESSLPHNCSRPAPVHTPQPTSVEVELAVEHAVLDEREGTAAHSLARDDGGKPAAGVWATVALFRDPRMLLLATIMIYSGTRSVPASLSFASGQCWCLPSTSSSCHRDIRVIRALRNWSYTIAVNRSSMESSRLSRVKSCSGG